MALIQARSDLGTPTYDPRDANLTRALEAVDSLRGGDVELAIFGELFLSGYRTDELLLRYATRIDPPDEHIAALIATCTTNSLHVLLGAATFGHPVPGDIYNSAILVGPGGVSGVYRKTHVAAFPHAGGVSMERAFYSPGRELPVFELPSGTIGAHICYDMTFPEVARVQTLLGAEALVNVAAAARGFEPGWEHIPYVRAVENAVWYIVCSVVGEQRDDVMIGGSSIIDPTGAVVASAKRGEEDIVVADIDLDLSRIVRASRHLFSDRQPTMYAPIARATPYP